MLALTGTLTLFGAYCLMPIKRAITIAEVAAEAGVSTQTVSRVINNRPDVSPETRQRVQDIVARLNYAPNAAARSLVSKRTHILGMVTTNFDDPSISAGIAGAQAEAHKQGYSLILSSTDRNRQNQPEYMHLVSKGHVEGLVFFYPILELDGFHLNYLISNGIPIAAANSPYAPGLKIPVVDHDNVDGGEQAARHLLDHGHRQIAMITGPTNWKATGDRTKGYTLALAAAGVAFDPQMIDEGDWTYRSGYEAMQRILSRSLSFSALFAQNDRMAIGAIRAIREAGLRVPEDVSVIGFDDTPGVEYFDPPLTTMRQHPYELGSTATQLLIKVIEEPGFLPEEVLLKTELIRRSSCIRRVE